MSAVRIVHASDPSDWAAATSLVAEYLAMLAEAGVPGAAHGNDSEALAHVVGDFSPPRSLMLVAYVGSEPAGCTGLRPLGQGGDCELKRFYVTDRYRGKGVGRALLGTMLEEARRMGYRQIKLDTLPFMTGAIRLYSELGFRRCDPYLDDHVPGVVCYSRLLAVGAATSRAE